MRDGSWAKFRQHSGPKFDSRASTGARLRPLPPYSPDLNPIELTFAKLKALLRRTAARTIPELWDTIAAALPTFMPGECANYFTACGYEPD